MFDLFLQGGTWIMSILTVELICLLFAAWKAPAWVREIGLLVLVTDLIWQLKGMFNAAEVVQQVGDVPLTLVAGGLKVSFIHIADLRPADLCRLAGDPHVAEAADIARLGTGAYGRKMAAGLPVRFCALSGF